MGDREGGGSAGEIRSLMSQSKLKLVLPSQRFINMICKWQREENDGGPGRPSPLKPEGKRPPPAIRALRAAKYGHIPRADPRVFGG